MFAASARVWYILHSPTCGSHVTFQPLPKLVVHRVKFIRAAVEYRMIDRGQFSGDYGFEFQFGP